MSEQRSDKHERSLELMFGALSAPLAQQIKRCGLKASRYDVAQWQRDVNAIIHLRIRGLLPSASAHKVERRLFNNIKRGVK